MERISNEEFNSIVEYMSDNIGDDSGLIVLLVEDLHDKDDRSQLRAAIRGSGNHLAIALYQMMVKDEQFKQLVMKTAARLAGKEILKYINSDSDED